MNLRSRLQAVRGWLGIGCRTPARPDRGRGDRRTDAIEFLSSAHPGEISLAILDQYPGRDDRDDFGV